MGGSTPNPKRQHEPSFKDGIFRDPKVAAAQDPDFERGELDALIVRSFKLAKKSSES